MNKQENSLRLPPTIPNINQELEQAITLLGNRVQTDLKDKTKKKLIKLVGEYPTKETAYEWKLSLKQIVKKSPRLQTPNPRSDTTYTCSLQKESLDRYSNVPQSLGETRIILDYIKYKLKHYYLEDEGRYDENFLKQLKYWYQWFPSDVREDEFSKKLFKICLGEKSKETSSNFNYVKYKYDLFPEIITPSESAEFIDALVQLALSKVDWKLLTKRLLKTLNLEIRS